MIRPIRTFNTQVTIPRALLGATRAFLADACRNGALDELPGGHHPTRQLRGLWEGSERRPLNRTGRCETFDDVYMAIARPSYGDLLGKVALLRELQGKGKAISWVHCPLTSTASTEENGSRQACLDYVPAAEHVRHPIQGAHGGMGAAQNMNYTEAALYGARLLVRMRSFVRGNMPLPAEMFHYANSSRPRSDEQVRHISRRLLRRDSEHTCGSATESRRGASLPTLPSHSSYATPAEDVGFETPVS